MSSGDGARRAAAPKRERSGAKRQLARPRAQRARHMGFSGTLTLKVAAAVMERVRLRRGFSLAASRGGLYHVGLMGASR